MLAIAAIFCFLSLSVQPAEYAQNIVDSSADSSNNGVPCINPSYLFNSSCF